jgi:hypothetical protein
MDADDIKTFNNIAEAAARAERFQYRLYLAANGLIARWRQEWKERAA